MKVLGIDQSLTSTGICLMEEGKVLALYRFCTEPDKTDPYRTFKRIRFLSGKIHALVQGMDGLDKVVLEELSYGSNGSSTRDLAMLLGAIVRVLPNVPIAVSPKSLKKYATGNGNSKKEQMHEAIKEVDLDIYEAIGNYPKTKGRYDLADAYWLAHYGTHYEN